MDAIEQAALAVRQKLNRLNRPLEEREIASYCYLEALFLSRQNGEGASLESIYHLAFAIRTYLAK